MFRKPALILIAAATLQASDTAWLSAVAPIITPAEKKTWLSLPLTDRAVFEENFWASRSIDREEYYRRIEYIDAKFGSSRQASGANTDPGRVYLSLGAPAKITRIPSSRIFVPLEIWYYDSVPGLLNTEIRLIFFQPNSVGLLQLYSPVTDSVRALLLPEASTVHMFGPNDSITESDLRRNLMAGPAEDEVVTAAAGIASGVKYSGNDEILGQITSPDYMLSKLRPVKVTSRLITTHPPLDILKSRSPYGGSQVDLSLMATAQKQIALEVLNGFATVYQNRVNLGFANTQVVSYTHRLDLLPGSYRLIFTVDMHTFAYPLEVAAKPEMGEIMRADAGPAVSGRSTPFEFEGRHVVANSAGQLAMVSVPSAGKVTWMIREGARVLWRSTQEAKELSAIELPKLPPGSYRIEAVMAEDSRAADLIMPAPEPSKSTAVSFNANLAPSRRLAFLGHQWLVRGESARATECLSASLAKGDTREARIELARAEAMAGDLDGARERVRGILRQTPHDFEALAIFAYIETKLQDYPVAAELYRQALAVQDSPALRMALAKLPAQ